MDCVYVNDPPNSMISSVLDLLSAKSCLPYAFRHASTRPCQMFERTISVFLFLSFLWTFLLHIGFWKCQNQDKFFLMSHLLCYGPNVSVPHKFICSSPTPIMSVFGDRTFKEIKLSEVLWWGLDPIEFVSVQEKTPESSLLLQPGRELPPETEHCCKLDLGLSSF